MSQDNSIGASAEITFKYVSLDAAIKRTRRHLAKTGASLIKSKPGTRNWFSLGDFSIRASTGEVLMKSVNLDCLMRTAELLADDERIELPNQPGWRYFVARHLPIVQDGKTHYRNEPLSKVFFSEKQAIRAADSIADKDGLVIVSFDATGRSGDSHAD